MYRVGPNPRPKSENEKKNRLLSISYQYTMKYEIDLVNYLLEL